MYLTPSYFSKGRHPHRNRTRGGFTLIELMVAITLFVIIISIAVGGFTIALRTQRQAAALISAESNVSLAVEQMTREVRTGYLFCHKTGDNNPTHNGNPCNCTVTGSVWSCAALQFYDSGSAQVTYSLANGALQETAGGSTYAVTGDTVAVKYLSFTIYGAGEGDHWTPRVTVSMGVAPTSTVQGVASDTFNLQTTVSSRNIDCAPSAGGGISC